MPEVAVRDDSYTNMADHPAVHAWLQLDAANLAVAYDWTCDGRGIPGLDICQLDPDCYIDAFRKHCSTQFMDNTSFCYKKT